MAVDQSMRLEAVISKLESCENELRQCKRILQYYRLQDQREPVVETDVSPVGEEHRDLQEIQPEVVGDRNGLWPGQIDYQLTDRPSFIAKQEAEEECET